jgi:hypothetical protein
MSHMKTTRRTPGFVVDKPGIPTTNGSASGKASPVPRLGAGSSYASTQPKNRFESHGGLSEAKPSPRMNVTSPALASANHGAYDRAVSVVMLGVTGVGALMASPAMAAPAPVVQPGATPIETTAAVTDSLGVESVEMPTVSLDDLDPVTRRANRVMEEFGRKFESRSRLTAYDMAHFDTVEMLEGHPGYKRLSNDVVKDMLTDAFKDMPLGALPAGEVLANLVEGLPGFGGKDVSKMSYEEISKDLETNTRNWLDEKFGEHIDEHKVESALIGFGAVASVRAVSPEGRDFINKHAPAIKLWHTKSNDGVFHADARMKYRNDDLLPNLDLSVGAKKDFGSVSLRSGLKTSLSVDRAEHLGTRLDVGVRVGDNKTWADASAWVKDDSRHGARFELGKKAEINGYRIDGRTRLDVGPGTSIDPNAVGRYSVRVEATKTFYDSKHNERGNFGFYGSHGMDTNGGEKDTHVGVMFRWSW